MKKAREKIPQITASVADHLLSDHQRFLIRHALRHLEFLDEEVTINDYVIAGEAGAHDYWAYYYPPGMPKATRKCWKRKRSTSPKRGWSPLT
jgi:hypothetical protein